MTCRKVHARDTFEDNNGGYVFGVEYYEHKGDPFPIEVEWFKTEKARNKAIAAERRRRK